MGPVPRLTRILFVALAIPVLTGCAALGLPTLPGGSVDPLGADVFASPLPGESPQTAGSEIASPDGYALTLPAGWAATDLSGQDTLGFTDALAAVDPALGTLARSALDESKARLSLLSVDMVAAAGGTWAPGIVVSAMRTRSDKTAARHMVEQLLSEAPLATAVTHSVEGLPAGDAHRYDAIVSGDTVNLELQVYVFRVGSTSFVVGAVAPEDQFAASQPAFDAILKSLRFGV